MTITRKQFLLRAAVTVVATGAAPAALGAEPQDSLPSLRVKPIAAGDEGKISRFILLGTAGGPILRKFRSQPSSLLVVDGHVYLFDVGYGCLHQLVCAGFTPREIEAVFLTHLHTDHTIDIPAILNFCWTAGRIANLPIVGPPGTEHLTGKAQDFAIEATRVFTAQLALQPPNFAQPRDIRAPGLIFSDERIKVFAAENTHYQTFSHGSDRSYSYRIECPDRVICLSGDSGPSDALAELAQGADMLVSEVINSRAATEAFLKSRQLTPAGAKAMEDHMELEHLPAEALGKIATKAGVKMVVCTHIVPGEDTELSTSDYTMRVRRTFNGPVIAGRDLLEL